MAEQEKLYKTIPNVPKVFNGYSVKLFRKYCQKKLNNGELRSSDIRSIRTLCFLEGVILHRIEFAIYVIHEKDEDNEYYNDLADYDTYIKLSKEIRELKNQIFNN
ncbi:hypothetical protein [Fodinibius salsisoli]|uniref:Uncharacterized protein n=1 Tax=Fodinibius salsisoli TaxID=2820877 RepID=A0ABT3PPA4_9BACT|nr:hypothetical protein [Fodinibius salsisoli]MCW9707674.1 hypothetical protein [Fodinibius salsisoli]